VISAASRDQSASVVTVGIIVGQSSYRAPLRVRLPRPSLAADCLASSYSGVLEFRPSGLQRSLRGGSGGELPWCSAQRGPRLGTVLLAASGCVLVEHGVGDQLGDLVWCVALCG
jgi:hypothetical protein